MIRFWRYILQCGVCVYVIAKLIPGQGGLCSYRAKFNVVSLPIWQFLGQRLHEAHVLEHRWTLRQVLFSVNARIELKST